MHISLDQALGRQSRLNRVGQSLLNIGEDAAAAYSLRSLNGGDPKVVNVRRSADDEEREFTASGVNAELENWVNGKLETTLPADIPPNPQDITGFTVSGTDAEFNSTFTLFGSQLNGKNQYVHSSESTRKIRYRFDGKWELDDDGDKYQISVDVGRDYPWEVVDWEQGPEGSGGDPVFSNFVGGTIDNTPAAAYSLRKVREGYTGKAVQIRRVYDNVEVDVDFDENGEVSDSSLIYNVDEETDDTGIIAGLGKASGTATLGEFIDQTDTSRLPCDQADAAAAYSLRKVREAYTGDVVKIRRASDNVEVDVAFDGNNEVSTSSAITNVTESPDAGDTTATTLGGFLTETVAMTQNAEDNNLSGFSTSDFVSSSSISITSTNPISGTKSYLMSNTGTSGAVGYPRINIPRSSGYVFQLNTEYSIKFKAKLISGTTSISGIRFGQSGSGALATPTTLALTLGEVVEYNGIINATSIGGSSIFNLQFDGTDGDFEVLIDDVEISTVENNASVVTWYDQSGNNNHATQSTPANQPKIADGGTYLGKLDFDGSHQLLASTGNLTQPSSVFHVNSLRTAAVSYVYDSQSSSNRNAFNYNTLRQFRIYSGTGSDVSNVSLNEDNLFFGLHNSTSSSLFKNGTAEYENQDTGSQSLDNLSIGQDYQSQKGLDGTIKEIIFYNSDQSLNRSYIEKNIGDHYGITVPDVSQDISVVTWYDQSGNGNDATQNTAEEQPLIAEGGSLVTKQGKASIDFTTSTKFLESGTLSITESEVSYFMLCQLAKDGATSSECRNRTFFSFTGDLTYIGSPNSFSIMDWKRFGSTRSFSLNYTKLNTPNLHTAIGTNSGANYYLNSSSVYSDSLTGTNSTRTGIRIGTKHFVTSHDLEGYFSEFIIYNSDQSANRFKIESNINNHYGIYTAAEDGFVETWFDQSGNGNDATQSTLAKQPNIVSSGSLIDGGVLFDGVDDRLNFDSSIAFSSNDFLVSAVFKIANGNAEDIVPVGHPLGNRFIMKLDYDGNNSQMRADGGTFLTQPFNPSEPTGNMVITVQRVGDTVKLFHRGNDTSTFNATGESFTVGNFGQRAPALFSKHFAREIIIYDSDQSSNRPAIETNIASHYDITLV